MINSTYKSNDVIYNRADTVKSDSNKTLALFQRNPENNDQIQTL